MWCVVVRCAAKSWEALKNVGVPSSVPSHASGPDAPGIVSDVTASASELTPVPATDAPETVMSSMGGAAPAGEGEEDEEDDEGRERSWRR